MTEQSTVWMVQAWSERYEYWAHTSEPMERLFAPLVVSYESEAAGRARLNALREQSPTTKYRLVRVVTTTETVD